MRATRSTSGGISWMDAGSWMDERCGREYIVRILSADVPVRISALDFPSQYAGEAILKLKIQRSLPQIAGPDHSLLLSSTAQ